MIAWKQMYRMVTIGLLIMSPIHGDAVTQYQVYTAGPIEETEKPNVGSNIKDSQQSCEIFLETGGVSIIKTIRALGTFGLLALPFTGRVGIIAAIGTLAIGETIRTFRAQPSGTSYGGAVTIECGNGFSKQFANWNEWFTWKRMTEVHELSQLSAVQFLAASDIEKAKQTQTLTDRVMDAGLGGLLAIFWKSRNRVRSRQKQQ